jgi:hypothetical protein
MPYSIGQKGSYGCSGYPVVKDGTSEVMGCHDTAAEAQAQISAINISEAEKGKKKMTSAMGQPEPASYNESMFNWSTPVRKPQRSSFKIGKYDGPANAMIKEGDFVMGMTSEGVAFGRVEHIMWEGGTLGKPGEEYSIESMPPENPAMSVRLFEVDDNEMEPTAYSIGMMYQDAQVVDVSNMTMRQENELESMSEGGNPNMEYMAKAETYSPNDGMKAAARRAIAWKESGDAKGAGTPVGWGRARDIVAGRSMSLSVVKRMYSFFSRHEVDKKATGFSSGEEGYPSKGRVMWDAWGGDAGFSWSRAIVERNKTNKFDMFSRESILGAKKEYQQRSVEEMKQRSDISEYEESTYTTPPELPLLSFGRDLSSGRVQRSVYTADTEKADSLRVGQMVSWNSSGGRATGRVRRIISNGSYDVPNTEITINGTEEDPAVVITLYRDGDATDTTVAHRMSTLRAL